MMEKVEHYVFQCAVLVVAVYCLVQAWKDNWWQIPLILAGSFVAFWLIYKYVGWLVKKDYEKETKEV